MDQLGKVIEWNDARGFGFVSALDDGPGKIFFHVRDYQLDGRRPEVGELVKFTATRKDDGSWRASRVRRAAKPPRAPVPRAPRPVATHAGKDAVLVPWLVLAAALGGLAWSIAEGRLPFESVFVVAGLSALTYIVYALDKHAAQSGRWRVQESTLHALELAGGWPGALIAQRVLRHKTRKPSYRVAFWCMVLLNIAAVAGWIITRT